MRIPEKNHRSGEDVSPSGRIREMGKAALRPGLTALAAGAIALGGVTACGPNDPLPAGCVSYGHSAKGYREVDVPQHYGNYDEGTVAVTFWWKAHKDANNKHIRAGIHTSHGSLGADGPTAYEVYDTQFTGGYDDEIGTLAVVNDKDIKAAVALPKAIGDYTKLYVTAPCLYNGPGYQDSTLELPAVPAEK